MRVRPVRHLALVETGEGALSMTQTTILTFSDLTDGDRFQIVPEVRKTMLLPAWTYRKVDDLTATVEEIGTRGIFKPGTPVVRSAQNVE